MIINFKEATYEKLMFLASKEGRSIAAFVAMRMDELTKDRVDTKYTLASESVEQDRLDD